MSGLCFHFFILRYGCIGKLDTERRRSAKGVSNLDFYIRIICFRVARRLLHVGACSLPARVGENLRLLIDPVELARLVGDDILGLEPESDLLLGALDAVRTVADVTADVLLFSVSKTPMIGWEAGKEALR